MKTRVLTYSIIALVALALAVPAIAFSQMGPRHRRSALSHQHFGAPGFEREFAGRGAHRGGFARARFGTGARPGLATRALARTDALGLSADQEQQIRAAQRAQQQASIERRAALQMAQLDMGELMGATTKDLTAIEAKLRELAELQITARTSRLYLDEAVSKVLTAEQLDELDQRPRAGRGRHGGRSPMRGERHETIQ